MSSRSTRIATVHPAFVFPCRTCESPVVHILENIGNKQYQSQDTKCLECDHSYNRQDLEQAILLELMFPCNSFSCPYCGILGIIMSEDKFHISNQKSPLFEDNSFSMPWDDQKPNGRRIIGTIEHQSIQWELPPLIVCDGCRKPVRLSTKGCLYIRSKLQEEPIYDSTDKKLSTPQDQEIILTPRMKSF